MKELIERLRYPVICTLDDRLEAADALERMTTELDQLIDDCTQLKGKYDEAEYAASVAEECLHQRTAERDALRADAMRYRFIFAESDRVDPVCAVVWKKGNVRNSSEWVNSVGGEWLSKELDAAIAGEKHD